MLADRNVARCVDGIELPRQFARADALTPTEGLSNESRLAHRVVVTPACVGAAVDNCDLIDEPRRARAYDTRSAAATATGERVARDDHRRGAGEQARCRPGEADRIRTPEAPAA